MGTVICPSWNTALKLCTGPPAGTRGCDGVQPGRIPAGAGCSLLPSCLSILHLHFLVCWGAVYIVGHGPLTSLILFQKYIFLITVLCRSCAGNTSCCEFTSMAGVSCQELHFTALRPFPNFLPLHSIFLSLMFPAHCGGI